MKQFFFLLLATLLLGAGPAWALSPLSQVVVPNGSTQTLTAGSQNGGYFYESIEIKQGGTGIFNDVEHVQMLLVRTGGTLVFGSAGEIRPTIFSNDVATITLEPGAIVQLANPAGLPFSQDYGLYVDTSGPTPVTTTQPQLSYGSITISPAVYYTFNGTAAQTTAAPAAPYPPFGNTAPVVTGIALPATVGRLTVNNSAGLTLANSTGVSQEVHLTNGQLTVASGATLTLLSSSDGTALLETTGGGTLNGPLTVQRYIDGSLNAGSGYRHLAAPVAGQTVASLATGSFTPQVNPAYNANPAALTAATFPTVFSYDEAQVGGSVGPVGFDQGWQSPAALTDALAPGRGYTVHLPPTAATGATLAFSGPLTSADVPVGGLGHTAADGGFHLLGNPYAAPLDWDEVDNSGLDGLASTLYVYKSSGPYAGSYTTYVPLSIMLQRAATAAPNVVPVGQAFFVYNRDQGSTGSLTFRQSQVIPSFDQTAGTPVQRPAAETRPYLHLTLQDAAGTHAHETLVYFEPAATPGFDARYDARYLPGAGQALALSTEQAGLPYAINALPALGAADVAVPLRLSAAAAGTYTLRAEALRNLPAGTHAYLLDASTGTRQDLAAAPSAAVLLGANASVGGRYSLLFTTSTALAAAPAALAQLAGLYPNPARGTTALVLPASLRGGQPTPVAIVNALGQTVRRATHPATADELLLPLDGLAPGLYTVQARTAAGTISRRLTVE